MILEGRISDHVSCMTEKRLHFANVDKLYCRLGGEKLHLSFSELVYSYTLLCSLSVESRAAKGNSLVPFILRHLSSAPKD